MKKILWTITAVGALALPVGIAAAQTDDDVVDTDTPTTVVCEHEREQLRLRDGTGDQERTQQRLEAHECDGCEQARNREQVRVEDGQGEMVRNQARVEDCDGCHGDPVRARVEDGTPQRDGAGPNAGPAVEPGAGRHDQRQYQEQDRDPSGPGVEVRPSGNGR